MSDHPAVHVHVHAPRAAPSAMWVRASLDVRLVITAVLFGVLPGATLGQDSPLPEAMRRLQHLEGEWRTDRVEFFDAEGAVVRTSSASSHNELELDGLVMVHRGRLDDPEISTRGWYFWSAEDQQLRMGSVSSAGRYDEFVGGWSGDRLVMTTLPSEAYGGRIFRITHSEISEDSYAETLAVSEDGGDTWQISSRQRMQRGRQVVTAASAVLGAMDDYIGRWRSDEKEAPDSSTFHFMYDLTWMDPGRTIARMLITRRGHDGSTDLIFEGVKGRRPHDDTVYYWAASPAGRASLGSVHVDADTFVTVYDGWTADGSIVQIRDIFSPVEGDAFVSRTYLRARADEDWRQIGEDHWTRIDRS